MRTKGKAMGSTHAYTSWWQFRADAWTKLQEATGRLHRGDPARQAEVRAEVAAHLESLTPIEQFWAYPGGALLAQARDLFESGQYERLSRLVSETNESLVNETYRAGIDQPGGDNGDELPTLQHGGTAKPYFEVLIVEKLTESEQQRLRQQIRSWRRPSDPFIYEVVIVTSGTEALLAARLNDNIQAVVVRRRFSHLASCDMTGLAEFIDRRIEDELTDKSPDERAQILARRLAQLRPELDLYLMTDIGVEEMAGGVSHHFRRVFHAREGLLELHLSLLAGVGHRYRTPFFDALTKYAKRPTGVFHALPISRGKSIVNSHWIRDMIAFYGLDIFLAETSATGGGLDSLLEPTGPLREAQDLAAETFGSKQTYFVTNGTSTANKIVAQALVAPGDIVLVDRNCHQSHHYGMMMAGAHVSYLDAYPLNEYSMYGAVPISQIKSRLLALRAAGKLDRVRMLCLTNCTFDGIVYDVTRVMEECLAIKPDLIFLWDEAWYAFARFHPVYRPRTGMRAARTLARKMRTPEYRAEYAAQSEKLGNDPDDETLLATRLLPDPDTTRVRVYATHSTHKTLTSLRQGSMIHVWDQDFAQKTSEAFHEAYMAHTSTSPNYQILASLDIGRRQAALEGFELVQRQLESAMRLRDAIDEHPLLSKYMRCLTTADLIPEEFRPSRISQPLRGGLRNMVRVWQEDEFVLEPSRVTLFIGPTGIDGATFKREQLMDGFGIQINKTSRNTVLFMTNIGTTRSSVAYLIEVLVSIARQLDERGREFGEAERAAFIRAVDRQINPTAPLPNFSGFHPAFLSDGEGSTPEGDVRSAFYLSYDDHRCEYLLQPDVEAKVAAGEKVVSATFVTPYPPGFPVLVPGQLFSPEILEFMAALDTPEIHGYIPSVGYRVYTADAIDSFAAGRGQERRAAPEPATSTPAGPKPPAPARKRAQPAANGAHAKA